VVEEYVPGVTNRADKPSRTLTTQINWNFRGDFLEEMWRRMGLSPTILRGRPQSTPPPLLHLLPIASRVQNKRNGAGVAQKTTAAHQPSMGDDPPNSSENEGRQTPSRHRGLPVSVGMVVAHSGIDEAGPSLHHFRKRVQRSRWPTGTSPDVAHTSLPAGRNPSGRYYKEDEPYL